MIVSGSFTTIGGSHLKSGKKCQDSSNHLSKDDYSIIAVADGHGGDRYILSDVGSKFAVESSIDLLSEKMNQDDFKKSLLTDSEGTLHHIEEEVIDLWRKKVSEYNIKYSGEINTLVENETVSHLEEMYGTTLIVAVMTNDFSFGFQIGDGDSLVVDRYGNVKRAMISDPNCFFNITTSLCQNDAINYFHSFFYLEPLSCILLSTDGYSSSFESEQSFERNILAVLSSTGEDSFWDRLQSNIKKRSCSNRMDDVSVALSFRDDVMCDRVRNLYYSYSDGMTLKTDSPIISDYLDDHNDICFSFKGRSGGYYGRK